MSAECCEVSMRSRAFVPHCSESSILLTFDCSPRVTPRGHEYYYHFVEN